MELHVLYDHFYVILIFLPVVLNYETKSKRNETKRNELLRTATKRNEILQNATQRSEIY
jgi:hypothetical protein